MTAYKFGTIAIQFKLSYLKILDCAIKSSLYIDVFFANHIYNICSYNSY